MRKERIIDENGNVITFRVVMSGDYKIPYQDYVRMKTAKNRLKEIIPDLKVWPDTRKKQLEEKGIQLCGNCKYPQPIENHDCCFCGLPTNSEFSIKISDLKYNEQ